MKKIFAFTGVLAAVVMMGSCGNKTAKFPFDNGDSLDVANVDPTIYGVCSDGSSMNVLRMVTDTGDTLTVNIERAQEEGLVLGGIQVGDRMAVVPYKKDTAQMVINQAALLGNWVMPNPIDGSDEVGITIKEGGIVEGIEQGSIVYKTWRLVNGQLELVMMREGGSEMDETYLYDIKKLTSDSLVFQNADDIYEYGRQKPKEQYGTDIKLEEVEDFKM